MIGRDGCRCADEAPGMDSGGGEAESGALPCIPFSPATRPGRAPVHPRLVDVGEAFARV